MTWILTVAIALYLWKTNILHQFLQFIPVWILPIVFYLIRSKISGAKVAGVKDEDVVEKFDGRDVVAAPPQTNVVPKHPSMSIITGVILMAALLACVVMPLIVAACDISNYEHYLDFVKKWLIIPTLIYFVFGTIWRVQREKRNGELDKATLN